MGVTNNYSLRLVRGDEYETLAAIKSDAYLRFGGDYVDRPLSKETFSRYSARGDITVVANSNDNPCGYSLAFAINGDIFLHHLFVNMASRGQGLGARLLEALVGRAKTNKLRAVTLCTTATIPWNAPYYSRHGFVVLDDAEMPKYLKDLLDEDRTHFTPQNPLVQRRPELSLRVAMERLVP